MALGHPGRVHLLFIGPTEVLLPYLVKDEFDGDATDLGLVLASGGLGAVAAARVVSHRGVPKHYMPYMYLTWTLATLAVVGHGIATRWWHAANACVLVDGFEAAGTIAWATVKQRLVPSEVYGRVSGVGWFVAVSLVPASYALAAPVAAAVRG